MNGNIELYTNDVNMTDTEVCVYTRWVNNFFFLFLSFFSYTLHCSFLKMVSCPRHKEKILVKALCYL